MKTALLVIIFSLLSIISQAQKKSTHTSFMAIGKEVYTQHCKTCHQVDGSGAPNMIPPLIKSDIVAGNKTTLIKILLTGLNGEIKVNGDIYAGEMPSQAKLTDKEIAAVLTYVRKSFENKASSITISEVKKIRAHTKAKQ